MSEIHGAMCCYVMTDWGPLCLFCGSHGDVTVARKTLAPARAVEVYLITFGRARLSIGPIGELWFDETW